VILDPETACSLIFKIRRLHGKELAEPDGADGSNDVDDGMDDVLVDGLDEGNLAEIRGLLEGMESEQREEFVALMLLGRDPDLYDDLESAKAGARDLGTPILEFIQSDSAAAEYLADGLAAAGVACGDYGEEAPKRAPAAGGVRNERR
jgi:hypothetical protein